ncbi:hypothetical protein [Streptomyces tsukubensis]|uniref:Adhesin n=1 Tax=Streptomyces tsukubensis TaxID=83656 RepID=A0A1V4A631_9ACTN|nr:hypothetical protein [Streptomyces tsukubensis]OON76175.1 hypothetical protein B1H18_21345 [Streptomyces tsukubensis]QFR93701.1 hypothetical protein GBW32_12160 [Streptomyces tsukubensis]
MIDEDWHGFTTAFAENVRPEDPVGRSGKRMLTLGIGAILVMALGAVVAGALGWGPDPKPSQVTAVDPGSGTDKSAALPAGTGSKWTAVAGPTCSTRKSTATFTAYGYYTASEGGAATGWTASDRGGYTGDGCAGGFLSIPVSGHAAAYDSSRFALWQFDFSAKFTEASCRISTYIPTGSGRSRVGGDPAYYYYYGTEYPYGSKAASQGGYLVHQVSKQGTWVTNKPFDVTTGKVSLKLVDAGAKEGSAAANAHAAAAQVRLSCSAT